MSGQRLRPGRLMVAGLILIAVAAGGHIAAAAEDSGERGERPKVKVKGAGWWKSREMVKTLRLLEPESEPLERLDAAYLEDAVVVLQSALERDGFARPSGTVLVRVEDGSSLEFPWEPGDVPIIPRHVETREATFVLRPGVRYSFDSIRFAGLESIDDKQARAYFVDEGLLFGGAEARRFSPALLRRGVANLREQLVRMGRAEAQITVADEERDERTGAVKVELAVVEGPMHRVGTVEVVVEAPGDLVARAEALGAAATGAVYSPLWQQDLLQGARSLFYTHGYAEVRVGLVRTGVADVGGERRVDFRLEIEPGPAIRVGAVSFEGDEHTRRSVMQRATVVRSGDVFDRARVERDRVKLSALGAFSSVRAVVDEATPEVWDLAYQVRPGKRFEASVMAGYGSYERVRGGLEVFHANLLGRAHRGRMQLIQSARSSSGDYLYTMPQIFGSNTDVSARAFGLRREEISFDRREAGLSLGLGRHIRWLGLDASLRYQFESIGTANVAEGLRDEIPADSRVAALTLNLTRDRLDNPVSPRSGYFLGFALETADRAIGGEVNFQRLDLRASWHRRLGPEQTLHVGARHGVLWALSGSSADQIPLAKRFFPGGENSVRGYREGEATFRTPEGAHLGAAVSTVLNLEFEQGLSTNIAGVVFVDVGLTSTLLADYPGDALRVSLGLGLRWGTVIGPIRLEYGRNIVREAGDRGGALHLSLGFPF